MLVIVNRSEITVASYLIRLQLTDTDNDKLKVISELLCVQHHYMNLETFSMADVAVMIETLCTT